jgi:hypothetical protein
MVPNDIRVMARLRVGLWAPNPGEGGAALMLQSPDEGTTVDIGNNVPTLITTWDGENATTETITRTNTVRQVRSMCDRSCTIFLTTYGYFDRRDQDL